LEKIAPGGYFRENAVRRQKEDEYLRQLDEKIKAAKELRKREESRILKGRKREDKAMKVIFYTDCCLKLNLNLFRQERRSRRNITVYSAYRRKGSSPDWISNIKSTQSVDKCKQIIGNFK
jgi:hypothetical protein